MRAGLPFALPISIILYVIAVLGSGLDRMSTIEPSYARLVPGPFRVNAAHIDFAVSVMRDARPQAAAASRAGLEATPAEMRGAEHFGIAMELAGNSRLASAAFRVSRKLGAREGATMLVSIADRVRQSDFAGAVAETEAVLRAQPTTPGLGAIVATMARTEEGREALAAHISSEPGWLAALLPEAPIDIGTAIALVLDDEGLFAASLGCEPVRPLVTRLAAAGKVPTALAIWRRHCPSARADGLIADGDFRRFAAGDSSYPFGWRRIAGGDVALQMLAGQNGGAIEAVNRAPVSKALMVQTVAFDQGAYTFTLFPTRSANRTFWRLRCGSNGAVIDALPSGAGAAIEVPSTCGEQTLELWLRPGGAPVRLEKVEMRAVA